MIKSKDVADKAHGWFRTWFSKVWHVRGGGLYAVGFSRDKTWGRVDQEL